MADDKGPEAPEQQGKRAALSRREFLVGTATGAVAGAVAAAGVGAVTRPREAEAPASPALSTGLDPMEEKLITLKVNGKTQTLLVKSRATLADVLRYQLGLTGTHIGCNRAECGACTVVMDGKNIYSCTKMAWASEGREITTIEGLAKNTSSLEGLHPLQRNFAIYDGGQCNFCIPGQIMSAYALLLGNASPTVAEIRSHLSGNICRCGNYQHITQAVAAASKEMGA